MRFNSFTGVDYENPSDADTDNVYLVQLTATEDKANGLSTVLDLELQLMISKILGQFQEH